MYHFLPFFNIASESSKVFFFFFSKNVFKYLFEEVLENRCDVMRREVRKVHLLLLSLKVLTELLDARL